MRVRLVAQCPMGCGRTIEADAAGQLTCMYAGCPNPLALHEIVNDEQTEHLVEFGPNEFTVRHPLHERLGDELLRCDLHTECTQLKGMFFGTFRAFKLNGQWRFDRV